MPTNVWTQWGSGKPKILIVTEIDALPEGSQAPGSIPRKPLVLFADATDAKRPLDMNRDMMEKFCPEMRKHYLNKTPRFN